MEYALNVVKRFDSLKKIIIVLKYVRFRLWVKIADVLLWIKYIIQHVLHAITALLIFRENLSMHWTVNHIAKRIIW